jgi:hypothetical protein
MEMPGIFGVGYAVSGAEDDYFFAGRRAGNKTEKDRQEEQFLAGVHFPFNLSTSRRI